MFLNQRNMDDRHDSRQQFDNCTNRPAVFTNYLKRIKNITMHGITGPIERRTKNSCITVTQK